MKEGMKINLKIFSKKREYYNVIEFYNEIEYKNIFNKISPKNQTLKFFQIKRLNQIFFSFFECGKRRYHHDQFIFITQFLEEKRKIKK